MSLTTLNSFGQTSVSYTEDRTARVLFDRVTAINQTAQTAQGLDHTVPVGIEIIDIIKPENINAYMEILISSVPTATVTLDTTPSGVTVESLGGGLHRIIPINSKSIWDQVKSPRVTIPNTQSTNFTYTVTIKYDPSLTKSYTVTTTIVNYGILAAQFGFSCSAERIPAVELIIAAIAQLTNDAVRIRTADISLQNVFDIATIANTKFQSSSTLNSQFMDSFTGLRIRFGDSSLTSTVITSMDARYLRGASAAVSSSMTLSTSARVIKANPMELVNTAIANINFVPFRINSRTGDLLVDWGDGVQEGLYSSTPSHTYSSSGDFTVKIYRIDSGNLNSISFASTQANTGIKSISNFGLGLQGFGGLWDIDYVTVGSTNILQNVPASLPSTITGFNFNGATLLNDINISSWDTTNLTTMEYMFKGCTNFNRSLSSWTTTNVTNMRGMFENATSFNSSINTWTTTNVITMEYMFKGATSFNQPLSNWNTANVVHMRGMFENTSFNQNIGTWNTAKVKYFARMFYNNTVFNQNIGSWNTGLAEDMAGMFYGASSFNQNIGSWNTSNVVWMEHMFNGASAFNQPIGTWNVGNVGSDFGVNTPIISELDPTGSTYRGISYMFSGASAFDQNISAWTFNYILGFEDTYLTFENTNANWTGSEKPYLPLPISVQTWGNTNINTTTKKFGTGSAQFDGSGDALRIIPIYDNPPIPGIGIGNLDYTIEFWARTNSSGNYTLFDARSDTVSGSQSSPYIYVDSIGRLKYNIFGADRVSSSAIFTNNNWHHIALSRSGSSTRLFFNGTLIGTESINFTLDDQVHWIGGSYTGIGGGIINSLNGYIDSLRLSRGIARYTSTFTPSTTELGVDHYTVYLFRMNVSQGAENFYNGL